LKYPAEEGEKHQLDRSCDKWRSIEQSQGAEEYSEEQQKELTGWNVGHDTGSPGSRLF